MEGWLATNLEIGSAVVGVIAVGLAVVLFVRHRSRQRIKRSREEEEENEWEPVSRTTEFGLASTLTRTIAKTEVGPKHCYPRNQPHPALVRISNSGSDFDSDRGSLQSLPVGDLGEDYSSGEFSFISDLPSDDQAFEENPLSGRSPEFLAEEWSAPTRNVTVEFSIMFAANTLQVLVSRITSFIPKDKPSTKVVKAKLLKSASEAVSREKSMTAKKKFDPEMGASLAFVLQPDANPMHYCLRLSVYETKFAMLKEKRLGDLQCSLAQLEMCPGIPVTCINDLTPLSKKDNSPSKKSTLPEDYGQLMLTLFYQVHANRMKVLVRKASNLRKHKRSLEKSEHYVILNTICGGQIVLSQETKMVSGRFPVWNHPFIFNLPMEDLQKYSMQFLVVKKKFNNHKDIVGQVVVGPDVRGTGHAHWIEAIQERTTESVMWHKLQPF